MDKARTAMTVPAVSTRRPARPAPPRRVSPPLPADLPDSPRAGGHRGHLSFSAFFSVLASVTAKDDSVAVVAGPGSVSRS